MLDTALTIQKRTAERIGVTEGALRTYQACVRYGHGEYFLRAGRWRRGASLTVGNLAGAPHSATAILERLARIIIPPQTDYLTAIIGLAHHFLIRTSP